ncbi:hypothetical protein HOY80DRAFT_222924 [Tuber brumale]|nr:hypothetical protein HOY80DRAFT_222924 [Tuber brumale]
MGNTICDRGAAFANYFETLCPLPSELEDLPLYPDGDGFYSVNGPAFYVNHRKLPTSHTLDSPCFNPAGQIPSISSHLRQHPTNTTSESAIPPSRPPLPTPPPTTSSQSRSGPQTLPQGGYACNEPGCTWPSAFSKRQGLTRHYQAIHLQKRIDCPIPECGRVGDKGIKRKDNVRAHVRNKHGVNLPPEPRRRYA